MGESLDDSVALWHHNREESKARRANNRERSAGVLSRHGVAFEAKNGGAHLIVKHEHLTADFWPGTGKFIFRNEAMSTRERFGCGVFNLLRRIGVTVTE